MTKKKIWLIVAAALVLFSSLSFVIVMSIVGWDFNKLSTVKYQVHETEVSESFSNISVNTSEYDVIFAKSTDGKCIFQNGI